MVEKTESGDTYPEYLSQYLGEPIKRMTDEEAYDIISELIDRDYVWRAMRANSKQSKAYKEYEALVIASTLLKSVSQKKGEEK